jgi:hypothetical protein
MKIPEQPVAALMKFGYSERESQFLYVVATFSGNFLRRHFTEFIGASGPGWPEAEFLKKGISMGHLRETPYKRSTQRRFHLSARSIYRAIDKENSANRKEAGDSRSILKLKFLSFVLDNFNEDYLEEETDKVRFFTEQRSIGRDVLPSKIYENRHGTQATVRYFVDKFPLFIANDGNASAIPTFTYFEDEYENVTSFPAHLNWYKPLLFALKGQYKLIYVADDAKHFGRVEKQFEVVLSNPHRPHPPALLNYFRLRQLWENKKISQLSDQDLATLNRAEKTFSRPEHETLYQQWLRSGLPSTKPQAEPSTAGLHGTLETYLLNV